MSAVRLGFSLQLLFYGIDISEIVLETATAQTVGFSGRIPGTIRTIRRVRRYVRPAQVAFDRCSLSDRLHRQIRY